MGFAVRLLLLPWLLLSCPVASSSHRPTAISQTNRLSPARLRDSSMGSTSSSPSPSSSSLSNNNNIDDSSTDMQSLDSYGHAIQLQHAHAAATRHGRSILALHLKPSMTYILYEAADGDDENKTNTQSTAQGSYRKRRITQKDSLIIRIVSRSPLAAVVVSGVAADGLALIDSLQTYLARVWERYDDDGCDSDSSMSSSSSSHLAPVISQLMQRFWNYDEKQTWQSSCYDAVSDQDWARPMGLQVLVMSVAMPCLQLVQPSGRTTRHTVVWMGRLSETNTVNAKLQDALQGLVRESQHHDDDDDDDDDEELLERLVALLADQQAFGAQCRAIVVEQLDLTRGIIRKRVLPMPTTAT